jgi:hypothetical protein
MVIVLPCPAAKKLAQTFFVSTFAGVSMTGCGPVYETFYSYKAPRTAHGLACVSNCEIIKSSCEDRAELRRTNCEIRADSDYRLCIALAKNEDQRRACFRSSCAIRRDDSCIREYNRCFQICGGTVTETVRCTANCPPDPPTP